MPGFLAQDELLEVAPEDSHPQAVTRTTASAREAEEQAEVSCFPSRRRKTCAVLMVYVSFLPPYSALYALPIVRVWKPNTLRGCAGGYWHLSPFQPRWAHPNYASISSRFPFSSAKVSHRSKEVEPGLCLQPSFASCSFAKARDIGH